MDDDASGSNVPERNIAQQNQNDLTTAYDSDSSGLPNISPKSLAELLGINELGQDNGTACSESALLEEVVQAGHGELFPISIPPYDGVEDALSQEDQVRVEQVDEDDDDWDLEESNMGMEEMPEDVPDFEEESEFEMDGDHGEPEVEDNHDHEFQVPNIVNDINLPPPPAVPATTTEGPITATHPPSSTTSKRHRNQRDASDATNDNVESSPAKRSKPSNGPKPKELSDEDKLRRKERQKGYRERIKQEGLERDKELAEVKAENNFLKIENASQKSEIQDLRQQLRETRASSNTRPEQYMENFLIAFRAAADGKTVVPQSVQEEDEAEHADPE